MSRFHLVRHAAAEWPGNRIAGRLPNIHLTDTGQRAARRLAETLSREKIAAVFTSPRERARETAELLAAGRDIDIAAELDEIDYGDWSGESLESVREQPRWRAFNSVRSCTRIPAGELIVEAQARVVGLIDRLRDPPIDGAVVLVSHAEVIRAALAYYLGAPLDFMLRLEIGPASLSTIAIEADGPRILCVNRTHGGEP